MFYCLAISRDASRSILHRKQKQKEKRMQVGSEVVDSKVSAWNSPERCITACGIRAINQMSGNERNAVHSRGSPRWPV